MSSNVRQLYSIVKFKKNTIFLTCRFKAILGYCGPLNNLFFSRLYNVFCFVLFESLMLCTGIFYDTLFHPFFCLIQNISSLYLIPVSNLDQSQFFMLNLYSRPFQIDICNTVCTVYLKTSPDPVKSITPKTYIFCRYFMNAREI